MWATRLFAFQFATSPKDVELRREVDEIAPALRALIDAEMAPRKSGGVGLGNDVFDRCLAQQAAGDPRHVGQI